MGGGFSRTSPAGAAPLEEIVKQAETETIRDQSVSLFATIWDGDVGFAQNGRLIFELLP